MIGRAIQNIEKGEIVTINIVNGALFSEKIDFTETNVDRLKKSLIVDDAIPQGQIHIRKGEMIMHKIINIGDHK